MWVRSNTVSCKRSWISISNARGPVAAKSATRTVQPHANQRCAQSGTTQTNGMRGPNTHKKPRANGRIERHSHWRFFMWLRPNAEDQKNWKPSEPSITQASQARRSHARRCAAMRSAPQVEHARKLRYMENPASRACAGGPPCAGSRESQQVARIQVGRYMANSVSRSESRTRRRSIMR